MPRETVTIRTVDADGNVVAVEERELMVRRPRGQASYAAFPSSTSKRRLIADNPPVIESRPPRLVQRINLREEIARAAASVPAGTPVRAVIVGMHDA